MQDGKGHLVPRCPIGQGVQADSSDLRDSPWEHDIGFPAQNDNKVPAGCCCPERSCPTSFHPHLELSSPAPRIFGWLCSPSLLTFLSPKFIVAFLNTWDNSKHRLDSCQHFHYHLHQEKPMYGSVVKPYFEHISDTNQNDLVPQRNA